MYYMSYFYVRYHSLFPFLDDSTQNSQIADNVQFSAEAYYATVTTKVHYLSHKEEMEDFGSGAKEMCSTSLKNDVKMEFNDDLNCTFSRSLEGISSPKKGNRRCIPQEQLPSKLPKSIVIFFYLFPARCSTLPPCLQFLVESLMLKRCDPSIIQWVSEEEGIFKLIDEERLVALWEEQRKAKAIRRTTSSAKNFTRALRFVFV